MTIRYGNYEKYEVSKGSDSVHCFWFDMHMFTFWAEYPINTSDELEEQVKKFEADRAAFDVMNYDCGSEFIKANREYRQPKPPRTTTRRITSMSV